MRNKLTAKDLEYVRRHYPNKPARVIGAKIKRSTSAVHQIAKKLSVEKTEKFNRAHRFKPRHKIGKQTRFRKGHVPANKGTRRPGWTSGRMAETQFRRGQRSGVAERNWRPIGTIRTDTEGYLRIKVRDALHGQEPTGFGNTQVWPLLHRHVWEQAHGPIPPGHLVIFKDGNRLNCAIENLALMTRADNARRNSLWNKLPRQLAEVIQLAGVLKRQIKRRNRNGS